MFKNRQFGRRMKTMWKTVGKGLARFLLLGLLTPVLSLAAEPTANDASGANDPRTWKPLADDGLHDPLNKTLSELQQPGEAMAMFPKDFASIGNQVDWVRALEQGVIMPRTNLFPDTQIKVLDLDIIMDQTSQMPMVRFPHKAHTQWLDCENCHDKIFKEKAGGNPVNMFAILSGAYCGRCHGAVAFPLTECRRCHSEGRRKFTGEFGAQKGAGKKFEPVMKQKVIGINQ